MKKLLPLAVTFTIVSAMGCATGEDKHEGTTDQAQPTVGNTSEPATPNSNTTGTAPPGDTAGVNSRRGVNDQTGPTGRGPEEDHPEAPAY